MCHVIIGPSGSPRLALSLAMKLVATSVQPEDNLNTDLDGDRASIFDRGREAPFADRLGGLLVEAHAQRTSDEQVARMTLGIDHCPEEDRSLILRLACLFRVFRIGVIDGVRSRYASTN